MTYHSTALDDLIDQFESEWSPTDTSFIRTTLEQFALTDDEVAVTELVRIDIERRYCSGLSCRLDDYFSQFPVLLLRPERAVEIAYEDYRVCTQLGHPIPPERYRLIPGIQLQTWHQHFQLEFLQEELNAPQLPLGQQRVNQIGSTQIDEPMRVVLKKIGFEPIQCLGSGTFSQVFLAQQNDLARRYVVLKVVRQPRGEPQMMAMLQHTNIVPIYSFHYVDSFSVICMPYAGGVTLNDYLHNAANCESRDGESLIQTICNHNDKTIEGATGFDIDEETHPSKLHNPKLPIASGTPLQPLRRLTNEQLAVWIFDRLAGALSHSHTRGVLHGDIKPANVLIRNDGEPALMDFNLSRSLQRSNEETVGGTLAYMSPESMRRMFQETASEDHRSDIYSLGMMLFELLTGQLPFPRPFSQADTDIEAAIIARQQQLRWPTDLRISNSLQSILKKCLAFEPSHRYESAGQLQEDLQRESQSRPLKYAREPIPSQLIKWLKRHPRSTSAASVSAIAFSCLVPLVWFAIGWRSSLVQAKATASFETFVEQSNDALLTMMADPQRYEESAVRSLLLPLENYGLLEQKSIDALIFPDYLDPEAIANRRNVLLRHTVSAAIAEFERVQQSQDGDRQLDTLTRLIETAKYAQGQALSRAVTHLEAKLAKFSGKPDLSKSLYESAEQLPISSDHEYYLEAVRLMADRKWSIAFDMIGALADRDAVPTALRWTSLGRTQFQLGQYEAARLSFSQSLERAPKASRLWLLRGFCSSRLRDTKQAENDFKQAVSLEPSDSHACFSLAQTYINTSRFQEAIEHLDLALRSSPNHFALLVLRSDAHRRLNNFEQANRDLEQAMSIPDLKVDMLVLRARTRQKLAPPDHEGALADLVAANAMAPTTSSIMQKMAYTYVLLGQTEKAIEILGKVGNQEPDNENAIVYHAVLLARQGRQAEALRELELALVEPNKPKVYYQAACVHALLPSDKSHVQALRYLSNAIQRGYGAVAITDDTDLDSLRDMPGFKAILKAVGLGKPPQQDVESSQDSIEEFITSEI